MKMGTPSFVLTVALIALAASLYFRNAKGANYYPVASGGPRARVVMVPRDPVMPANGSMPSNYAPVVAQQQYAATRGAPQPSYARTSATEGVRYY
jgi:hypothetical protein